MKTLSNYLLVILFIIISLLFSCKKKQIVVINPPPPPSSSKYITGFDFKQLNNGLLANDVIGSIGNDTIKLEVPQGISKTTLKPTIRFIGKSIVPENEVSQDFSSAVIYTVTAEDGSTKSYVVVVEYKSLIFFTSSGGALYSLDPNTGQENWRVSNGQFHTGSPLYYNGVIYACGKDGMYAINSKDGSQKWKYPIAITPDYFLFGPTPIKDNNSIYFGCWDGFVYSLNAADGSLKWKLRSYTGKGFWSNPTISNNQLYIGCQDSLLYSINTLSGSINWTYNFNASGFFKNPLIVENYVFAGTLGGKECLLNKTTGTLIWSHNSDGHHSSATFHNGLIYSGGGTTAYGYNLNTGSIDWILTAAFPVTSNERSSIYIKDGFYFAGNHNGKVYCYRLPDKNPIWTFNTGNPYVDSSPVVVDGSVFIGHSSQNNFYSINATNGNVKWQISTLGLPISSACVVDKNGVVHNSSISGEHN